MSPTNQSATLLSAQALSRSEPISQAVLLHPSTCDIYEGDQIILKGPSGFGKSLFLRTLALLDAPSKGNIFYKGELITTQNTQVYRTKVTYVGQHPVLIEGSVLDNIRIPFSFKINRTKKFEEDLLLTYLDYFTKPQEFLYQHSSQLSGGEQQITCFLRVLMLAPPVLLLDEPTAALDSQSVLGFEALVRDYIKAQADRAFVWISHDEQQGVRMGRRHWRMLIRQLEVE